MFLLHMELACKNWLLQLDQSRMKGVGWSFGMLKAEGHLETKEAAVRKVLFSRISYEGHPYFRVEIYKDINDDTPAVYAYIRDGDEIFIVLYGTLSEVTLAAMLNKGIVIYKQLKGGSK